MALVWPCFAALSALPAFHTVSVRQVKRLPGKSVVFRQNTSAGPIMDPADNSCQAMRLLRAHRGYSTRSSKGSPASQ